MPLNQNQYGRLRVIHNQLNKKQKRTFIELKNACETELSLTKDLGVRTLKYDIQRLREEFNAPLVCEGGFYYYKEDFSIFDILDPEEVQFANQMNTLLGKLAELPILKGFEDFQMKIRQRAGGEVDLIQFEQVEEYAGKQLLPELYQALLDKRCLRIIYRNFESVETQHTMSPYVLREYNNRWYIFGWEHEQKRIFNFPLDRIRTIQNSAFPFLPDKDDVAAHLAHLIGVTRPDGAEPQEVKVRVKKSRAFYLITKPMHKSQRYLPDPDDDGVVIFTYRLILNKELTATLLSLGTDAEILDPAELRQEIAECARAMWERYGGK